MIALQIGSNKGYDDFTNLILNKTIDKLILVEPFKEHNESLNKCYFNIKNKHIENIIITNDSSKNEETIFYHEEDSEHDDKFELASLNKNHSLRIRENYTDSGIRERVLKSMTVNDLLLKYNIKELDLLFIDTEGMDEKIIKSINFNMFKIKEIYYENLHVDIESLKDFLIDNGYEVTHRVGSYQWSDYAKLKI